MTKTINLILILIASLVMILFLWQDIASKIEMRYDAFIAEYAHEYGVDPLLIKAIIWKESRFRPNKIGRSGERGLMQIREPAVQDWVQKEKTSPIPMDDLLDPKLNIQIGSWYLGQAFRRWKNTDNPMVFALAEYNAGRRNALHWVDPQNPTSAEAFLKRIDFPSTKIYILKILERYKEYKGGFFWLSWNEVLTLMGGEDSRGSGPNQKTPPLQKQKLF
ncbi:lytic transglycosylase domain-containing protein [Candidatus Methylacidiphilum infernorum]|uniref:Soluble lytic murein transglycosylase n=1 Tax=Methylacidiphilum infernorum (isolate V4) TaxID=481448 RepID=B3DX19_METI4|nr:lytic transglycosylase domain-containing protein [Candidatus Methylacidiphilum infernorum]ACD82159.1 Soluble lytic murein transglycosylase [Methylacidiphilum infernorum V4]